MYYLGFYDLFDPLFDRKKVPYEPADAALIFPSRRPSRAMDSREGASKADSNNTAMLVGEDHYLAGKIIPRGRQVAPASS